MKYVEDTQVRRCKVKLKYLIEKVPKGSTDFVGTLDADGLTLFTDPKNGLSVKMTDPNGKEYRYSFQKDLGIDTNIIPQIVISKIQSSKVSQSKSQQNPKTQSSRLTNIKDSSTGSSRNAEHEIHDSRDSNDPDEEWKRHNGYKM